MGRLLVVEDDASVREYLDQALREAGYTTVCCADGREASVVAQGQFDLILLDVMLPGMDGFQLCTRLREARDQTPILLITAKDRVEDKVKGLDSGADDYLVKPFPLAELLARVRALLRRGPTQQAPVLKVADLELDPGARRARRAGRTIRLSSTEYALLEVLVRNAGRVVTRSSLLEQVWDYDFSGEDNVLDVYISYLRGKIDKGHPVRLIHTVRGTGYRLEAESG